MSFSAILLCSCGSKAEKVAEEVKEVSEQYIKDLDNAKSKEEASKIRKEYRNRIKFESKKLSDEEIKEFEDSRSWDEYKEMKELNNRTIEAEKRAKERFSEYR